MTVSVLVVAIDYHAHECLALVCIPWVHFCNHWYICSRYCAELDQYDAINHKSNESLQKQTYKNKIKTELTFAPSCSLFCRIHSTRFSKSLHDMVCMLHGNDSSWTFLLKSCTAMDRCCNGRCWRTWCTRSARVLYARGLWLWIKHIKWFIAIVSAHVFRIITPSLCTQQNYY